MAEQCFNMLKALKNAKQTYRMTGVRPFSAVSTADCKFLLLEYQRMVEEWEFASRLVKEAEQKYNKLWRASSSKKQAALRWLTWAREYQRVLDRTIHRLAKAIRRTGDLEARSLWMLIDHMHTGIMSPMFGVTESEMRRLQDNALVKLSIELTDN